MARHVGDVDEAVGVCDGDVGAVELEFALDGFGSRC